MASLRTSFRHIRLFSTTSHPTNPLSLSSVKSKLRAEHDPDKALEIYKTVSNNKNYTSPLASRYTQDLTIKRLAKSKRFEDIQTLINSHKNDPKIKQENYFSTLIRSYGIVGMCESALKLYGEMEELGTPRSSISFNALLVAYNFSRKFDEVPKLFSDMSEKYGIVPDKISYAILIKAYCELSLPESAFSVMKKMDAKGIEITAIAYTTILDSLYKNDKIEEAEKLWKDMIEKGCLPDVCAYNVRIMNAHRGKPEGVLGIIDEMSNAGLKPNIISYNYLFTCYCKNGMVDEAKKVYRDLGCSPNAATYRLHIDCLCKNGEFEEAYKIFKKSVNKDKIPAFGTIRVLVEGLVKDKKGKEAREFMRIVKKKFPNNFLNAWKKLEVELGLNMDEESSAQEKPSAVAAAP
ncbi:hypothetical protein IFM89_017751 [Coptis chinensis]|uniref:Pentatricopeptide repeat-containing protein n=1 Tax=Coptis chinensis TaxID=261450 RepID=A0A835HE24_9MAGN|nr:hypothetical protein IFM89_017751 [Coptis chinensis]